MTRKQPGGAAKNSPPFIRPSAILQAHDVLNIDEVAVILRVNPWTVRRLVARGTLSAIHVGRCLRIHRDELGRFMETQSQRQPTSA